MLRKILLPTILLVLTYGFWVSPDFKEISAGVAIFLFGMLSLEMGFKSFTGGTLERILKNTTDSLSKSMLFGIVSTTLMQSSSLVSVITISFLSAGLLGLAAGIGIIFGANIGTTTGAWLVAGFGLKVKISAYAMPMLVFGVLLIFQKSKTLNGIGYILGGMGFLFLGIHHMKDGFDAFKETIDLAEYAVAGYPGLFLFTAIGIAATVIMQSSHATLVLTITALAAGQITYENGLALAIGANVGTTITAIIGSMSANEQGKRLAGAHLIFNMVTGLLAIGLIQQMMLSVDWISSKTGIAADDYTLKLAVFHTLFNLLGVIVMVPFIGKLVVFLQGFIKEEVRESSQPRYLDESAIDFPDTAMSAVRRETLNLFDKSIAIIGGGLGFSREEVLSARDVEDIIASQQQPAQIDIDARYEQDIKGIHGEIIHFISRASFGWDMQQSGKIHWLRNANQNIAEAIKDAKHLQKNMLKYAASDRAKIRPLYNHARVQVVLILRELVEMSQIPVEESGVVSVEPLKIMVAENNEEWAQQLDHAIRDGLITPAMASSFLNDKAYVQDISLKLISLAETLFVRHELYQKSDTEAEAGQKTELSQEELDEVRKEMQADTDESAAINPLANARND